MNDSKIALHGRIERGTVRPASPGKKQVAIGNFL